MMPKWNQWLKVVYDTEGNKPSLIVTGNARINSYKKIAHSLAGRYFRYLMHPLGVREMVLTKSTLSHSAIVK